MHIIMVKIAMCEGYINSLFYSIICVSDVSLQTQVCVLQTTLDLLERNYDVHIVADGVSSRTMVERMTAIEVRLGSSLL